MRTRPTILFFSPDGCPVPALVRHWASVHAFPLMVFDEPGEDALARIWCGHVARVLRNGSPWEEVDPDLQRTYSGAESGEER